MKTLNKNVVLVAACNLMINNGQVTTLEVKNNLRASGYDARQNAISSFMRDLATEEKWDIQDTGNYKVYGLGAIKTSATKGALVEISAAVTGCWEVNATTSHAVKYYDNTASRSQVRYAFAKTEGVNYDDTRSRIAK